MSKIKAFLSGHKKLIAIAGGAVSALAVALFLVFGPVGRYAYASSRCETEPVAARDALSGVPDGYFDAADLKTYAEAFCLREDGKWEDAERLFASLDNFRDSRAYKSEMTYRKACVLRDKGDFDAAAAAFTESAYDDWETQVSETYYLKAGSLEQAGSFAEAAAVYASLGEYRDSADKELDCLASRAVELCDAGDAKAAAGQMAAVIEKKGSAGRYNADASRIFLTYAQTLIDAEDHEGAVEWLERVDAAPYKEEAEQKLDNCNSMITYNAAVALEEAGDYAGAVALYDTIPGFSDADARSIACERLAYHWKFDGWTSRDGTKETKTASFTRSDTIYFYGTLSGGKPGKSVNLRFSWVDAMGATANTTVKDWKNGTSGGVTFSYTVPKNANVGKSTIYVYEEETGEQIGKVTFTIRQ